MVGTIGVAFVLYTWFGRVPAEPKPPHAAAGGLRRDDGHHLDARAGRRAALQLFMLPQKLPR